MSQPIDDQRKAIDVLIAAPYPSVRRGLAALLAEFPDIVPREAVGGASHGTPDVIVSYVSNGQLTEQDEHMVDDIPVVYVVEGVLAELPEIADHPVALLPAEADSDALRAAVIAVSNGLSVVDITFASSSGISWRQPHPATAEPGGDQLTAREIEVLNLVARGWPNKTIASELSISEHTVKFHVGSILGKLGAESRTEAVTIATRRGLVVI